MLKIRETLNRFDRLMAAITFAEAGQREPALDLLYRKTRKKVRKQNFRIRRSRRNRPDLRI
ncbi:MAG: hypothetical protein JRH18_11935 [Deltaproteobacteria bacterium]|nr:hypothetical protein [Deltaproteobacteria bacterium]MBW2152368.1 hypothetical protein [Deltaproteobacteria bacterium]